MKPKLFLAALLLVAASTAAVAQKSKPTPPSTTVHFSEAFTSLVVDDNLNVVLTEGTSPDILVEGDAKSLVAREVDGSLLLSFQKTYSANQTTVYVPASLLSKVYLNGTGTLRSATTLQNRQLKIILTDEARVHVKSTGNVSVETWNEIDFVKGR
jgi:hypothetical protein